MLKEKDYCDYDTCVALSELGFDEKCFAYYDSEDNVGLLYNEEYTSAFYPVQYTDLLACHNVHPDGCIDAPTLYEAQKWLREEKSLHIEVRWYSNMWYEYEVKEAEGKVAAEGSAFPTYEEALRTAVYMAIEHLKEK